MWGQVFSQETALHVAVQPTDEDNFKFPAEEETERRNAIIELLLNRSKSINRRESLSADLAKIANIHGEMPLQVAMSNNRIERSTVELLANHAGVKVKKPTPSGATRVSNSIAKSLLSRFRTRKGA